MQSSVGATASRAAGGSAATFVKQQFRNGYEIPVLPYQKYGILSKVLWPSKNQVIRIIPGYDPSTGEVFRQNINCTTFSADAPYDSYLSDTFYMATIVSRFGDMTAPFIVDYAPGSPDEQKYGGETVLRNFIRGIMYACSNKSTRSRLKPINEWKQWAGIGPQATLAFDKQALLMQALVFHVNGRNNQNYDTQTDLVDEDGDILPLLAVVAVDNKLSITNVMQALVDPMNPGLPLDAATNNKYGAMAEPEGNKLFLNTYNDPTSQHAALRPSVQAPGQGWTPTPFPLGEDVIKQLWHPWEELLNYMTADEQLALCAEKFGADTVNYVIGTDPKFGSLQLPAEIRGAGLGRYASLVGGSVTLSSNGFSPSAAQAQPPAAGHGLGKGLAGAQAAAPAFSPATQSAPPPFSAPKLSGIPAGAGVDVKQVMDQVAQLRKASGMAPQEQADAANELLAGTEE